MSLILRNGCVSFHSRVWPLSAFLNGILDASKNTIIVDGNENVYYYTGWALFPGIQFNKKERALALIDSNRSKYALQVQAGHALYIDHLVRPYANLKVVS